jgi:predicted nucleic acid-binding protein
LAILDTSIIIDKLKNNEQISDNITEVSVIEYPPILSYTKFSGKIFLIQRKDILLTLELQIKLRKTGKPKGLSDLLIAAISINRQEELLSSDEDFEDIVKVCNLKLKIVK